MPHPQVKRFKAGVIGASGRLGTLMTEKVRKLGLEVSAIASRPCDGWPSDIGYLHHADPANWSALIPEIQNLDVLVIAAPLASNDLHRIALDNGCHVVDAGISEPVIRDSLALDDLARQRGLSIVLMAGLAPGLSGLLARDMALRFPTAQSVDITLLQSSRGTAGKRGVSDMLDMLTDPKLSQITQVHACHYEAQSDSQWSAFSLPTPETVFLAHEGLTPEIRYHTLFDAAFMNRAIRLLRKVRGISLPAYCSIRNLAATAKSKQERPKDERACLAAVATTVDGTALGRVVHVIASDYSATAEVAAVFAKLACSGKLLAGAGHPADFTSWSTLIPRLASSFGASVAQSVGA
jgi:hypothetical protein